MGFHLGQSMNNLTIGLAVEWVLVGWMLTFTTGLLIYNVTYAPLTLKPIDFATLQEFCNGFAVGGIAYLLATILLHTAIKHRNCMASSFWITLQIGYIFLQSTLLMGIGMELYKNVSWHAVAVALALSMFLFYRLYLTYMLNDFRNVLIIENYLKTRPNVMSIYNMSYNPYRNFHKV